MKYTIVLLVIMAIFTVMVTANQRPHLGSDAV